MPLAATDSEERQEQRDIEADIEAKSRQISQT